MRKSVSAITIGSTSHLLSSMPEPPMEAGNISHRPNVAVARPIPSMPRILPKAGSAAPASGETCSSRILFIPNQLATASGTNSSNHTQPALKMYVSVPAGILPISVPDVFFSVMLSPPNNANVITSGTRICMVVTPKFPRPAFIPSA